jgi:hypothetical protein
VNWDIEKLESFFGAKVSQPPGLLDLTIRQMEFQAAGMHYLILLTDHDITIMFDPQRVPTPFPAFECTIRCDRIDEIQNLEPHSLRVLRLFEGEIIRVVITRTRDGDFSLSPHWQRDN